MRSCGRYRDAFAGKMGSAENGDDSTEVGKGVSGVLTQDFHSWLSSR